MVYNDLEQLWRIEFRFMHLFAARDDQGLEYIISGLKADLLQIRFSVVSLSFILFLTFFSLLERIVI